MNYLVMLTILRYIDGAIPPAVFLAVLWVLLEPKYSRKTAVGRFWAFWASGRRGDRKSVV